MNRGRVVKRARLVARAQLPTSFGDFRVVGIEGGPGEEAVAILRARDVAIGESAEWEGAAGARAFAMFDWGCVYFGAMRLPGAT